VELEEVLAIDARVGSEGGLDVDNWDRCDILEEVIFRGGRVEGRTEPIEAVLVAILLALLVLAVLLFTPCCCDIATRGSGVAIIGSLVVVAAVGSAFRGQGGGGGVG
jgi:hypothetical protein